MKSENNKQLKDTLFERIECEGVCPRPKVYFMGRECLVWMLWLLSVWVGALSFSVSLFVMSHSQYSLYEATHENLFTYLVDILPYVWMITFGLMVYVGIYNLRHTKKGYKYPLWMVFTSSLVLSIAGGSVLHAIGFSNNVDYKLGSHMDMYMSQEKVEQKMWQDPSKGRLIARQVLLTTSPTSTVVIEDLEGQRWQMIVTDLPEQDLTMLGAGKNLRIIGKSIDHELRIFHACGTFSWMMDADMTTKEMNRERREFLDRMQEGDEESGSEEEVEKELEEKICSKKALFSSYYTKH